MRMQRDGFWYRLHQRSETGSSNSIAVLLMVPILLLVGGLVIDYGVKISAESDAYAAAQAAARIAAHAGTTGYSTGQTDPTKAVYEGQQALAASNLTGEVWVDGTTVHVRAHKSARTYFLGIVGVSEVTGTAEATAVMVTDDTSNS